MRLIDADALEPHEVYFNYGCERIVYMDDIDEMPTIVAEPVIRCKDCKHFDGSYPMCCRWEETIKPDDYCSYGEKTEVKK